MGQDTYDCDGLRIPGFLTAAKASGSGAGLDLLGKSSRILFLLLTCGLAACVTTPVETDSLAGTGSQLRSAVHTTGATSKVADQAVGIALQMKGVPYVWGGATPAGFDCSGLIHYAYAKAGMQVPRNSRAQFAAATKISQETAEPGDLLFFVHAEKWHVALYMGNDKFIHAPWPGSTVSIASLRDDFYSSKLIGVGRLTR